MSAEDQSDEEMVPVFRAFTPESLAAIESRIAEEKTQKENAKKDVESHEEEHLRDEHDKVALEPDPNLESGMPLRKPLLMKLTSKSIATPLEDMDKYYENKRTFVVISKGKDIYRFSATNALYLLSPFNPVRRGAIYVVAHPLFRFLIFATIVVNFLFMTLPSNPFTESAEIYFLSVFTIESVIKILAMGFIFESFTYLRDPWNWLDFVLNFIGYITMGIDLGNLSSLRAFRTLRAFRLLKILILAPGVKPIMDAISGSIKKMKDVIILTCFSMSFFAVLGLQLYMGILTSKCIYTEPLNTSELDEIYHTEKFNVFSYNRSYQYIMPGKDEPKLCRASANLCPPDYTCLMGFGNNPNYGFTNFDTFSWALLSSVRLMTQDFWEDLYQMILITAGPWHMLFFLAIIFMGSFYLLNLFLATVVMTYDELLKKEEEAAAAAEKAAMQGTVRLDTDGEENKNLDSEDGQAEGEAKLKEKSKCLKCIDFCCIWNCCTCWTRFQECSSRIIFNPLMELFIFLCILANTLFMAMDHHNMTPELEHVLSQGNYFFTSVYVIEAFMKIIAMSPKFYFQDGWNKFDFFIVVIAFLELILEGVQGLSVLRAFRLLRIYRLAEFWPALHLPNFITKKTVKALANLTSILLTISFIFAVLGMRLFGIDYIIFQFLFYGEEIPRWNYIDFLHSFMTVFRAFCGEWIETMWDCMLVSGWTCIPFYIAIVFIGNILILSLYLAVLLPSFGDRSSTQALGNDKKTGEAPKKMSRAKNWIKTKIFPRNQEKEISGDKVHPQKEVFNLSVKSYNGLKDNSAITEEPLKGTNRSSQYESDDVKKDDPGEDKLISTDIGSPTEDDVASDKLKTTTIDIMVQNGPEDCCPSFCYGSRAEDSTSGFWAKWKKLREKAFTLVQSKYFEAIIITVIIASSLALTAEDVDLKYRPNLKNVLMHMDKLFAVLFLFEMLIKWLALGFKRYFTNAWCWLEFIIVLVSMFNLAALDMGHGIVPVFKTMRVLRILWLLKPLSRYQAMRLVLNTFVQAIPGICHMVLVSWIIWLVFAIMGVQLFGGKFYYCTDDGEEILNISYVNYREDCMEKNLTWVNKAINFDNVLNAYLALFQVATFKGWIDIMYASVDSRMIEAQPVEEVNLYMYLYFVCFVIVGSFITLSLFTGVIIRSFNQQKKKAGGSQDMVMTRDQMLYYNAMKKMGDKKPVKAIPRPKIKFQAAVFDLVSNPKFDLVVMILIGLLLVMLATDHYNMNESFDVVLHYFHLLFVLIFTVECVLKIFAFRWYYFKNAWNVYEFVVVILLILGIVLNDVIEKYFVSPTLLLMLRVAKVGLVLRPIKGARGIRALMHVLAMSLPSLFSIFTLLFLVMFIYAIFGMSFFMTVKHRYGIDENFNFETFGQSMLLMFPLFTAAGWDGVLFGIMEEEDCKLPEPEIDDPGNCGSRVLAVAYLVSYVIITFLIINKMFIAVILENYIQAIKDAQEGLTDDDYHMYYETWQRFDPEGTGLIHSDKLIDLLDALQEPLWISKPNKNKIISMDIPICEGDRIYHVDILEALVKDFFLRKGHIVEETTQLTGAFPNKDRGGLEVVSSTLSSPTVMQKNSWT